MDCDCQLSDAGESSSMKVACGSVDDASSSDNVEFMGGWESPSTPVAVISTSTAVAVASATGRGLNANWLEDPDYTIQILDLPTEILEKIFLFTSYEQIGKVRRVCSRFNAVGSSLLNSAFQRLQTTMLQRFQQIKSKMPRRESARRNHPFARECDIVETVHMRLTLLQMSFGKHIERKHCCFFAGEILDEVYRIFRHIKSTPNLGRAYKVTDELFDLTTMAMEYFKEYIEPELPEITYFAADFIDCNGFSSSGMKSCAWKNASPSGSPSNSASPGPVEESQEMPPTSVLINKKIKRLRQGMKKNNGQVIILKRELKSNKSQIADQQKQLIEYGTRLEDNDKKFEEYSRKFSSLLQELNKCKTELQYWRSKSPANQACCSNCSSAIVVGANDGGPIDKGLLMDDDDGPAEIVAPEGGDDGTSSISDVYEFVPIPIKTSELSAAVDVQPCHSGYRQSVAINDECTDVTSERAARHSKLLLKRKSETLIITTDDGDDEDSNGEHKLEKMVTQPTAAKRCKTTIVKCPSSYK